MSTSIKYVSIVFNNLNKHWVGDGFHVHGLLRHDNSINYLISPFLMLDYASPEYFSKTSASRGVGDHPHRGFETVTFAYQGEIVHKDSTGGGGLIGEGDVQWMTAGSGVIHSEYHSEDFSNKGGIFEMVQLWINLPSNLKMTKPKYQSIKKDNIPSLKLSTYTELKVVAGKFKSLLGPAKTFTDVNIFQIFSKNDDKIEIQLKEDTNTLLLIMHGTVNINDKVYEKSSLLVFEQEGDKLIISTSREFKGLLLNGTPINESIVAYGPFVMNTKEEISKAILDFQNGEMDKRN